MQNSSLWIGILLFCGGVLVPGICLWIRISFQFRKKLLLAAADYAGYAANNYELFAQGREPSYQELLDGIHRQADRLGKQARFLATQMRDISPGVLVSTLDESDQRIMELACAYHGEYARGAHTAPVLESVRWAQQVSKDSFWPQRLRELLEKWSADVLLWQKVAKNLTWYFKGRLASGHTK